MTIMTKKELEAENKSLREEGIQQEERIEELEQENDAREVTSLIGTWLGDGVYVAHDGYALVLNTTNGEKVTNRIVLEPEVYANLIRFVESGRR